MWSGLKADMRTIMRITTMRYALVGIAVLQFTVSASAPGSRSSTSARSHVKQGNAEGVVGALIILGGIPGILLGGRVADCFTERCAGRGWRSLRTAS